jgi:aspartate/methionine/tyrosine aminotransferase
VPCPEGNGFLLGPDELKKAITTRTRGIILNSPSNPTGAVYSASHLAEIAKVALDADIWVLSDDVYEHISYDGLPAHIFTVEPRLRAKGIVFNSLSKTYAMAHWIRGRPERGHRRRGAVAGPEQRKSQLDHAVRRDRGVDRTAGRCARDG